MRFLKNISRKQQLSTGEQLQLPTFKIQYEKINKINNMQLSLTITSLTIGLMSLATVFNKVIAIL